MRSVPEDSAIVGVPWHRDPVVWVGLAVGLAASAMVFFAGRYLPYNDWAGHVGMGAVLAHGSEQGADVYLRRSLAPSPYLLFYAATAAWSWVVPAEVGAKLNLLIATAVLVIGGARLAEATGRSPRVAVMAPLGLFGISLGMGFSSFLFALPWILMVLADLEHLLSALDALEEEGSVRWRRPAARLSVWLALCFLGHGLAFAFALLLVAVRMGVFSFQRRRTPRSIRRGAYRIGLALVPALALALPSVVRRIWSPYVSPEFRRPEGPPFAGWVSASEHMGSFARDLLDRGGAGHGWTALLAGAVFATWIVLSAWERRRGPPRPTAAGPWVYAITATLVFLVGPVYAGWPITFWVVHQRAGSLALVLLTLLPTARFKGAASVLALLGLIPVVHNAWVNAPLVADYSAWAAPYTELRRLIPPGQRVLPLTQPGTLGRWGHVGGSLGFLLLADGAAYVPAGDVPYEVPVRRRNHPATPPNLSYEGFTPAAAAAAYDYLLLRGDALIARVRGARGAWVELGAAGGWALFENRAPPPRPAQ